VGYWSGYTAPFMNSVLLMIKVYCQSDSKSCMQTTVTGCSKELASALCLSQLLFAAFFILDTNPNVFILLIINMERHSFNRLYTVLTIK
jgi:hypothetical protein